MEEDTRGNRKKFKDAGKRNNVNDLRERQYRKDARLAQSQTEEQEVYEPDDSEKFLRKMREKEEKQLTKAQKNEIYEQEMEKCQPKPKGKVGSRATN